MKKGDGVQQYDCPKCGDPCISPEGHVRCGTRDDDPADKSPQGRILAKIRKLLALAEGTTYEEEAASAWAKAQELMQEYAIDEALLRQKDKRGGHEQIVTHVIPFRKQQARRARKLELLRVVARANRVRSIDSSWALPKHLHLGMPERLRLERELADKDLTAYLKKEEGIVFLVGLESDVAFVELLYMTTLMQAWRFMSQAYKEHNVTNLKAAFGSSFLAGFNGRVASRLAEQNRKTEKEIQQKHERASAEDGSIVLVSVSLALKETRALVDAAVAAQFPDLKRGSGPTGGRDPVGYGAGQRAGDRADLSGGRNRLGGGTKRLTS